MAVSRRKSITISIATILSTTSVAITTQQQPAHADEPNNLYYKSEADEEDPLAVFGKSLQSMSSSTLDNATESGASTMASSTSTTNSSGASSLSFSDISLPSSGDDLGSSQGAGDLGMALQQKKEEQKGRVDPRTHG